MEKYNLTPTDIISGADRILADAYSSATISENPTLIYITAGPGAGKAALGLLKKKEFKAIGEKAYSIDSNRIAEFHPNYEEIQEEMPTELYRITRQFVRPVTPIVLEELMKAKINIINENTLNKGEHDIQTARKFRENGYRLSVNIMATDIFESRLSCFEKEVAMLQLGLYPKERPKETHLKLYNSFVPEVQELDRLGYLDEINVYVRGENINKPPILKYQRGDKKYRDFNEAVITERNIQRRKLLENPAEFLQRIKLVRMQIEKLIISSELREEALRKLRELENDFLAELTKSEIIK